MQRAGVMAGTGVMAGERAVSVAGATAVLGVVEGTIPIGSAWLSSPLVLDGMPLCTEQGCRCTSLFTREARRGEGGALKYRWG